MEAKIGFIVQARMGSTRLPGKSLMKIGDKEMLLFLIERLEMVKHEKEIVLATTTSDLDDYLVKFATQKGLAVFRGSENNVLERFFLCAKKFSFDIIVRITADDPFKDPNVIEKALNIFLENEFEYVSNTIQPTYPEGIDIEIFSFEALEKSFNESTKDYEKQHVTPFILDNDTLFKSFNFKNEKDYSQFRLTCDYQEDLDFLNKIYSHLNCNTFTFKDVIDVINKNNILNEKDTFRNEGLLKDKEKENEKH